MWTNIVTIQRFETEIYQGIEEITHKLWVYRDAWLEGLRKYREEMERKIIAAGDEADRCLKQRILPESPLSKSLVTCASEGLQVVQCSVAIPSAEELWSSWVTYSDQFAGLSQPVQALVDISEAFGATLASVCPENMKFYDMPSDRWVTFPLSSGVFVDSGTRYIWVDKELFCSGGIGSGDRGRSDAYLLSSAGNQWQVTNLPSMMRVRWYHAMWWSAQLSIVHVFGGTLPHRCQ